MYVSLLLRAYHICISPMTHYVSLSLCNMYLSHSLSLSLSLSLSVTLPGAETMDGAEIEEAQEGGCGSRPGRGGEEGEGDAVPGNTNPHRPQAWAASGRAANRPKRRHLTNLE